ncbi:MCM family protein [Tieghemostelium lacteum]|uniref:DNA helicase n=1 Tax=Tieghemostelium lacteum TaxID=361077 RepID=A0A151ZHT8_TIELA|nr:MCM family protein [Tieghemostelium lacteum]|eukprot:KYQ93477.1 MCM family protein [Tieghemostelium lacteum]
MKNTQIVTQQRNDISEPPVDQDDIEIPELEKLLAWDIYFPPNKPAPNYKTELKDLEDANSQMSAMDMDSDGDDDKSHSVQKKRYDLIKQFINPLYHYYNNRIYAPDDNNTIAMDYLLLKNDIFKSLREFDRCLKNEPEIVLDCIGVCMYEIIYRKLNQSKHLRKKIKIRLFNFEPILPLRKLRSNLIGKYVSIKGTVIRVGNVKPMVMEMQFTCSKCREAIHKYFPEGKVQLPTECVKKGCTSRVFEPNRSTATTCDWQKIKLQEEIDQRESSGAPRTVDCELTDDLIELVVPGDVVTLSGVVKVLKSEERGQQQNRTVYLMYIDVNSVESNKKGSTGKLDTVTYSLKDMYGIKEIAEDPNVFQLIVNSICPAIYGHHMVKAGLTLALFGGTPKNNSAHSESKNRVNIRSDPHVLIVGDPGLGKSQMLKAVQALTPRGVMVCGGLSTIAGLTVTLLKEPGSGDFALEAGALVLSDQGCCFIDEFDKMSNEHPALLEAMEQQSVSIAKAGIVCNLPARTSVIAAANPVGGHYNRAKTVSENIKMSLPVLSRFDLIFILMDKPNSDMDQIISHHITDLHSTGYNESNGANQKKRKHGHLNNNNNPSLGQLTQSAYDDEGKRIPLKERLIIRPGQPFDAITTPLLRKYISYAKKYVQPRLTEEAAAEIQRFYLELRSKSNSSDSMPVTTRQLESLIRLCEARAKLELRELVTKEDALDIIEIMKDALFDSFEDEYGNIDFRRATGMSKSNLGTKYISILSKEAKKRNCKEFSKDEIFRIIKESKLPVDSFDMIIENLNFHGRILKKAHKYVIETLC